MKTYTVCTQCSSVNGVDLDRAGATVCGACKAPLKAFHDGLSDLGASQLNKLIENSPLPVVVDFWAPWCGPCKAFAPTFLQAAKELAGFLSFVKVDTEANPFAGDAFRIQAIPTLALFRNALELGRLSGALPLPQLKQWLNQTLAGPD